MEPSAENTDTPEEGRRQKEHDSREVQELEALLKQLRRGAKRRKFWRPVLLPASIASGLLYLCLSYDASLMIFLLITFGISLLAGLSAVLWPKEIQAAKRVAALEDIRILGPLLAAADLWTEPAILKAMTHQALRLKASDAGLLSEKQRSVIRMHWFSASACSKNTELPLAFLKALEQIGDEKDLEVVQYLTLWWDGPENMQRIASAAQECLPFLQARVQQQRFSQTLLRAASSPPTESGVLLRPAGETVEARPQELLRSSQPSEE